jgi:hypothetical protein
VHLDVKYLPQMPDEDKRRYLFVAIGDEKIRCDTSDATKGSVKWREVAKNSVMARDCGVIHRL